MRFDPSAFNVDLPKFSEQQAPEIPEFKGLELAQGISPLTFGLAEAVARGSQFKIASSDLLSSAEKGIYPQERTAELEASQAELSRRLAQGNQGFTPQDLSLAGNMPISAQLTGQMPTPPENGQISPATGNFQGREQLAESLNRLTAQRQNLQMSGLDTSGLDNAITELNKALSQQPQAPAVVTPELQDWQKVALGIAALFGGGEALQAVSEGIRQGVITRADIENQANQAEFGNKLANWRTQVQGLGDIAQTQQQRINTADRTRISEFTAEDRRLAQSIDDVQRQIEQMDKNEQANAKLEFQRQRFDTQAAQAMRKLATQEQETLLTVAAKAPKEARRILYRQLRDISDPSSVFGMMSDEQLDQIATAPTLQDRQAELAQAKVAESALRAKDIAARTKVNIARAKQIEEETRWIPREYKSRIEQRRANTMASQDRLALALQNYNLQVEKFKASQDERAAKEAVTATNELRKATNQTIKSFQDEAKVYESIMKNATDVDSQEYLDAQKAFADVSKKITDALRDSRKLATQSFSTATVTSPPATPAKTVAPATPAPSNVAPDMPKVKGIPPGGLPKPTASSKGALPPLPPLSPKSTPKPTAPRKEEPKAQPKTQPKEQPKAQPKTQPKTLKTKKGTKYEILD
jgi:hypothetical protein